MTSNPDNPMPSVEPSTDATLALYKPEDFDIVMSNAPNITNSDVTEQYKALQKNYNLVTQMFDIGVKASQNQVAKFEQQVQQASIRFASEVWAAIARYGKQDAERQKAIDNLYKTSMKHQPALETLDERGARQQSVLERIDTWASQINDSSDSDF
ncbi:hypothetical protein QBC32DRAFT_272020 [Pseudoneurospora amorphoporcata]|uniref:Uncharacterized protein n=1 Tax=Pseudoneurospora amorphoporcata TaxID=241081 RepID=A0AAN6NIW1_9PEZI|nr:hypothetical protein QBC32DRAFT_272020 [Pseudoneurospora amorphoporcata]